MMQVQDESMYRTITNCRRGLIPAKVFGRGICKIGIEDDSYCEFQTALIAPEDEEYEYIKDTSNRLVDFYKTKAKQLAKIPDDLSSADLISSSEYFGPSKLPF